MTLWQEINEIQGTKSTWRQFGLTLGGAFALLAGILFWREKPHAVYFAAAGGFFAFFGLLLPGFLKPIHKIWMGLALVIGWVMARVLLTALFFLAITPIGVLLRLFGKDLLDLRLGPKKDSYWSAHKVQNKEDYEKQF